MVVVTGVTEIELIVPGVSIDAVTYKVEES